MVKFFRERDGLADRIATLRGIVHGRLRGTCTISNRMCKALRVPEISRKNLSDPSNFSGPNADNARSGPGSGCNHVWHWSGRAAELSRYGSRQVDLLDAFWRPGSPQRGFRAHTLCSPRVRLRHLGAARAAVPVSIWSHGAGWCEYGDVV